MNTINDSKLIQKIKENFTIEEQKLYIISFYSYLKYNEYLDFVISIDDIWKWLNFSQKDACKRTLTKHFKKDENYKK